MNGRGSTEGGRVALFFLVEGQQRHVRRLDDLQLNPRNNCCYHPFVTAKTHQNSALRECSGIFLTSLNGEVPLVKHTSLSAFDWTGSYGPPFRGRASAPAGKPQPLFHMGSYLTSNSINAATAPAGKPQPLFHAGSYLTSNSINVAKVVVKELQRLWEPRNWNREILPWHVRVREGSWLVVDHDGPRDHADGMVVRWPVRCNNRTKRNRNAHL